MVGLHSNLWMMAFMMDHMMDQMMACAISFHPIKGHVIIYFTDFSTVHLSGAMMSKKSIKN